MAAWGWDWRVGGTSCAPRGGGGGWGGLASEGCIVADARKTACVDADGRGGGVRREGAKFPCVRRSRKGDAVAMPSGSAVPPVVLGDTMGELRKFYALADVAFVGRTLVNLGPSQHGSDMIEPAALGRPVIVGPFTGNFAEAMNKLRAAEAVMEVVDEATLAETVSVLRYS